MPPMAPPGGAASPPRPPVPPPGSTAPATMRPDNQGMQMRGRVQVSMATAMLTEALKLVNPMSEEGQDIVAALKTLGKRFGSASGDMQRAEAKLIAERAGAVSQPGPENVAAMKQAIQSRLQSQGIGGAAAPPSPAPPMPGAA